MKVVIVGGVAGGATAAARLRRLDENAQIVMIERTGYVSYANCGLPYFVGGVISDRAKLTLQTPESFKARFNVDARVREEVVRIDREAKRVTVRRLADGSEYEESYDKLILSPGAHVTVPDIPGTDANRMFTLRTVEDTFAISDFIERARPRTAAIVGAGFIGLEMAENLAERGIAVTVLQRGSHVMPTLDEDMAAILHNTLRSHGVKLVLGANVTGFEERCAAGEKSDEGAGDAACGAERDGILTLLDGAEPVASDMAILAVGVTPEGSLAREAGLDLGIRGSIKVDEHMRTSDPDIYAVGDAVQVANFATEQPALIALAGPANKQGRIAADNICGIPSTFRGSQGTSVMKVFDRTVASTGLTCKAARAAGLDCDYVLLSPANHATYYPGSCTMTLKMVYECGTGRVLGAQAIGGEGVEKRIDVVAVAMRARMTAHDLTELDLAYAPPYSSAKDPVNMAGYIIENVLGGRVRQVSWDEVIAAGLADGCAIEKGADDSALRAGDSAAGSGEGEMSGDGDAPLAPVLLDTRTAGEYARGHIEGALHVPLDELRGRLDELPRDREIWVHCQSGLRSYIACRILSQNGFSCANVAGGYGFYAQTVLDRAVRTQGVGSCGMAAE